MEYSKSENKIYKMSFGLCIPSWSS